MKAVIVQNEGGPSRRRDGSQLRHAQPRLEALRLEPGVCGADAVENPIDRHVITALLSTRPARAVTVGAELPPRCRHLLAAGTSRQQVQNDAPAFLLGKPPEHKALKIGVA